MSTTPMQERHVLCTSASARPWLWTLAPRRVQRLAPAGRARWLVLECGRVWLTRSAHSLQTGDDVWLAPGDRLLLPAGSEWVAEAWPEARWVLLEAPQRADGAGRAFGEAWRGLLQRWFSGAAPPAGARPAA